MRPWNRRSWIKFRTWFRLTNINTNALNLITPNGIGPHPIPLPSGERGGWGGLLFNMARSIGYHSCNLLLSKHEKVATGWWGDQDGWRIGHRLDLASTWCKFGRISGHLATGHGWREILGFKEEGGGKKRLRLRLRLRFKGIIFPSSWSLPHTSSCNRLPQIQLTEDCDNRSAPESF